MIAMVLIFNPMPLLHVYIKGVYKNLALYQLIIQTCLNFQIRTYDSSKNNIWLYTYLLHCESNKYLKISTTPHHFLNQK